MTSGKNGGYSVPSDFSILAAIASPELGGRPWKLLSQGEKQRVLIGRALMAEYRVLFLDEPCAVPDPVARERFLEMIERIGGVEQAPTLVLVTHHVEEITPAFIHVLMMKKGRVLPLGRRDRVMTLENLKRLFDENGALGSKKRGSRYTLEVMPGEER